MKVDNHRQNTISSIKWSGLNQVFKQGLNIGIGILLARMLKPSDFGLLGMITVFTGFIQIFNDFGLGSALIFKQDADRKDYNSVFWTNLFTGILFCAMFLFGANFIAKFYKNESLVILVQIVSFVFIIQALGYVQNTLLRKTLNFKSIFFVEFLAMVISGSVAIYMAFQNFGVFSLVGQIISNSLVCLFGFWFFSSWRPNFFFSFSRMKALMGYSLPLLGSSTLGYLLGNFDKLIIGRFLGTIPLGIYTRSYSLMVFPVGQVSGVISQVIFPSFAQIQEDNNQIKGIFVFLNRTVSTITFPLMAVAFIFADSIIPILLGNQWLEMIPIFRVLTVVGAIQSVGTLIGNIYLAKGAMRVYFWVNLFSGIVFVVSSIIGLQFGLMGVTIALACATCLLVIPHFYITGKLIGLSLKAYFGAFIENAIVTIVLGIIFYLALFLMDIQIELKGLSIGLASFFISFYLILFLNSPSYFKRVIDLITKK